MNEINLNNTKEVVEDTLKNILKLMLSDLNRNPLIEYINLEKANCIRFKHSDSNTIDAANEINIRDLEIILTKIHNYRIIEMMLEELTVWKD